MVRSLWLRKYMRPCGSYAKPQPSGKGPPGGPATLGAIGPDATGGVCADATGGVAPPDAAPTIGDGCPTGCAYGTLATGAAAATGAG